MERGTWLWVSQGVWTESEHTFLLRKAKERELRLAALPVGSCNRLCASCALGTSSCTSEWLGYSLTATSTHCSALGTEDMVVDTGEPQLAWGCRSP